MSIRDTLEQGVGVAYLKLEPQCKSKEFDITFKHYVYINTYL